MRVTRICFITGHYFGYRALCGILSNRNVAPGRLEISLLLTVDASKKEATVGFHDFSEMQREYRFPHAPLLSVKTAEVDELVRKARPDYILAIGLSELLPKSLLDIPRQINAGRDRHEPTHGCIGMHPTLLPLGRGRAPIPWTIIKGLSETGVTAFLLEELADAGGIICQDVFSVGTDETATTLYSKCAASHERLGSRLAPLLAGSCLTWFAQDEARAVVWPKRRVQDGAIDFSQDVHTIDRLVRALTPPYPGAFFYLNGRRVVVNRIAFKVASHSFRPGYVVATTEESQPVIAAQDGFITCVEIVIDGSSLRFEVGQTIEQVPKGKQP